MCNTNNDLIKRGSVQIMGSPIKAQIITCRTKQQGTVDIDAQLIILVTQGEVEIVHNGIAYPLRQYEVYFMSLTYSHLQYYAQENTQFMVLTYTKSIATPLPIHFGIQEPERILSLAREVLDLSTSIFVEDNLLQQAKLYELVYQMTHHYLRQQMSTTDHIHYVQQYIDTHYNEVLSIKALASLAQMSEKYFTEQFKKTYGSSVMQYVTQKRLHVAKHLLSQQHMTLKEIAHAIGYKDEFYFSRRFKQEVGVAPSEFKKNRQQKIAVLDSSLLGIVAPLYVYPEIAPIHLTWRNYYYEQFAVDVKVKLLVGRAPHIVANNIKQLLVERTHVDTIFTYPCTPIQIQQLQTLAKVVVIDEKSDWQTQLVQVAQTLQVEVEATQWLQHYKNVAQKTAKLLQRQQKQCFLMLLVKGHEIYLYQDRMVRDVLINDLQLQAVITEPVAELVVVTVDDLLQYDPDFILLLVYEDAVSRLTYEQLHQHDLWQEMRAVRQHQSYEVPHFPWRDYAALPHLLIIEQLAQWFAE